MCLLGSSRHSLCAMEGLQLVAGFRPASGLSTTEIYTHVSIQKPKAVQHSRTLPIGLPDRGVHAKRRSLRSDHLQLGIEWSRETDEAGPNEYRLRRTGMTSEVSGCGRSSRRRTAETDPRVRAVASRTNRPRPEDHPRPKARGQAEGSSS